MKNTLRVDYGGYHSYYRGELRECINAINHIRTGKCSETEIQYLQECIMLQIPYIIENIKELAYINN